MSSRSPKSCWLCAYVNEEIELHILSLPYNITRKTTENNQCHDDKRIIEKILIEQYPRKLVLHNSPEKRDLFSHIEQTCIFVSFLKQLKDFKRASI